MPRLTQLSIDNPCHENWDRMTPAEQGRHCAACQRTVVDFTEMKDAAILQWLNRRKTLPDGHPHHTCGRFHADQLNRPLAPEPTRRPAAARAWHYLLAAFLFSAEASAQTGKLAVSTIQQQHSPQPQDPAAKPATPSGTLRGQIRGTDGKPVPFASIIYNARMYNARHGVQADDSGRFTIPAAALTGVTGLTVSAIGYQTLQVPLSAWAGLQEKIITVQISTAVMGEVVVIAGWVSTKKTRRPVTSVIQDTLAAIGLAKKALTIYPNPVARGSSITLSMRLDTTGAYTAQLFSLSGILEETLQIEADAKSGDALMNIPATLSAGAYFVRLSNPNLQKVYTQQVLIF